jgi:hypothetical protein
MRNNAQYFFCFYCAVSREMIREKRDGVDLLRYYVGACGASSPVKPAALISGEMFNPGTIFRSYGASGAGKADSLGLRASGFRLRSIELRRDKSRSYRQGLKVEGFQSIVFTDCWVFMGHRFSQINNVVLYY